MDLFVDTSRSGISIALLSTENSSLSYQITKKEAKGESIGHHLDSLLKNTNSSLSEIKRVMVALGPGSFSGLRTGIAFCEGICFSKKRELYGVSTLEALECFSEDSNTAVITKARKGFWYLRLHEKELFSSTEDLLNLIKNTPIQSVVVDINAKEDASLKNYFEQNNIKIILDEDKPIYLWESLFKKHSPSVIQEANYIQPSYFEKSI